MRISCVKLARAQSALLFCRNKIPWASTTSPCVCWAVASVWCGNVQVSSDRENMGQQQHNAIIPNRSGIIGRWLAERALCCQPERIRADRGVGSPRPFTSQSIWRPYTITIFFKRSLKSMKLQFAQSACDQRRRACSERILLLRGSSSYHVQEFQALERFAFVISEPESVRSWCA